MTTYKTILFKGANEVECYTEERPQEQTEWTEVDAHTKTMETNHMFRSRLSAWQKSAVKIPFKTQEDFNKVKALGREDVTGDVDFLTYCKHCNTKSAPNSKICWCCNNENLSTFFIFKEPVKEEQAYNDNFNNWVSRDELNKWHKVDKVNFTPPPTNYNLVFFVKGGSIYCGHYKGSVGFVCYGIGHKELTDVEVTHWRILDFPEEYQKMLDDQDK